MLKYVNFAVKLQINAHDLNNEAVAGNVTDIRVMEFIDENGNKVEAPAVSGRMLKHWHYEAMRKLIISGPFSSLPLCMGCRVGEPIRPGEKSQDNTIVQVAKSEEEAIKNCSICDIHGYLIAQDAKGDQKGISSRRTSRAMFSWLLPVLEIENTQKQVLHTRVSQQESISQEELKESKQSAQMIFSKSYASGIYAFVSALDVDRVGLVEMMLGSENPYPINDDERRERIKLAIEAYRLMFSGQIGASLSHALPHTNPIEILVGYSETSPLPFPVSPIYSDYIEKTVNSAPFGSKILYWGDKSPSNVMKKTTINEIFDELLSKTQK
ncbi:MAG: DevR family CRISPR-associated autoregulator [Thermodesulfovibrio sp.]|nr:DevR family CRISPR-associated autoregulator [Thermodesulfovibrio sp.]